MRKLWHYMLCNTFKILNKGKKIRHTLTTGNKAAALRWDMQWENKYHWGAYYRPPMTYYACYRLYVPHTIRATMRTLQCSSCVLPRHLGVTAEEGRASNCKPHRTTVLTLLTLDSEAVERQLSGPPWACRESTQGSRGWWSPGLMAQPTPGARGRT